MAISFEKTWLVSLHCPRYTLAPKKVRFLALQTRRTRHGTLHSAGKLSANVRRQQQDQHALWALKAQSEARGRVLAERPCLAAGGGGIFFFWQLGKDRACHPSWLAEDSLMIQFHHIHSALAFKTTLPLPSLSLQ